MAQVTQNIFGIVVELDNDETKKLVQGVVGGGAGAGGLIATACAATAIAAPLCAAIVAAVGAYAGAQAWLINNVNTGGGVYLTLPWPALYAGAIAAIIPTTRPIPGPGLAAPGWAAVDADQIGTNDPADIISYRIDRNAINATNTSPPNDDVVEFVLVIGPQSSGWDKAVIMPDGEGNEWEIKATGGKWGEARNQLWSHQVHNGQQLRFLKPKVGGVWHTVASVGWLHDLRKGDRCTFTWLRD